MNGHLASSFFLFFFVPVHGNTVMTLLDYFLCAFLFPWPVSLLPSPLSPLRFALPLGLELSTVPLDLRETVSSTAQPDW